jgi:hypothetical protein
MELGNSLVSEEKIPRVWVLRKTRIIEGFVNYGSTEKGNASNQQGYFI